MPAETPENEAGLATEIARFRVRALVEVVHDRGDHFVLAGVRRHGGFAVVGDADRQACGHRRDGCGARRAVVGLGEIAEGDGGDGLGHVERVGDGVGRIPAAAAGLAGHDAHFARAGEGQRHRRLHRVRPDRRTRRTKRQAAGGRGGQFDHVGRDLGPAMAGKSIVCGPPMEFKGVTEAVSEFALGQPP
jgi:hypothetical protein